MEARNDSTTAPGNLPRGLTDKGIDTVNLTRPLAIFDLETTGLDVKTARIIEIAITKIWPDGTTINWARLVSPSAPLLPIITEITGLTDADLHGAPSFADIAAEINIMIEDADLAGHNSDAYDIPLLEAEFARAGVKMQGPADRVTIDTKTIFAKFENHSLSKASEFYLGQKNENAHRASGDVLTTHRVLVAQLEKYELAGTLGEIESKLREPYLDKGRKFIKEDGVIKIAFGKYNGSALAHVIRTDPRYCAWMQDELGPEVAKILSQAIKGMKV